MEGLIPCLIRAMKKPHPANAYRCLSDTSTAASRSYHLLLAVDSAEDSFHRRIVSDFQPQPQPQPAPPSNGLRHRGFTVAAHHY